MRVTCSNRPSPAAQHRDGLVICRTALLRYLPEAIRVQLGLYALPEAHVSRRCILYRPFRNVWTEHPLSCWHRVLPSLFSPLLDWPPCRLHIDHRLHWIGLGQLQIGTTSKNWSTVTRLERRILTGVITGIKTGYFKFPIKNNRLISIS